MKKTKRAPLKVPKAEPLPLKIDIGCGKRPKDGFVGVDAIDFGQKYVCDVRKGLPFKPNTVDEVHSSHFVEHLDWPERVAFFNELYRVMKVGATVTIITPHWSNACFYGDPTHKAPLSEWYVNYLNKDWRATEAPHTGYTCDFTVTSLVGTGDGRLAGRNPEYLRMAMGEQMNAWRDLVVTLTKR